VQRAGQGALVQQSTGTFDGGEDDSSVWQEVGMRILVISPVARGPELQLPLGPLSAAARPGTTLEKVYLDHGPVSVECELDRALAVPGVVARACEGVQRGFDAVMIYCVADPGLSEGRSAVQVPVIGAGQAGMLIGALLGQRFSLVVTHSSSIPFYENQCKIYGLWDKLASVRAVNIPVLELDRSREVSVSAFVDVSIRAIEENNAHAIVLGCTGTTGWGAGIAQELEQKGYPGIPVVEPAVCALKLCETLIDMRLAHSRRTCRPLSKKEMVDYEQFERLLEQGAVGSSLTVGDQYSALVC
jgi:allantoin racemase